MTTVNSSVSEFSIAFYPPTSLNTILFCTALAITLAVGAWLGMRFYLHLFGTRTEGTVTDMRTKISYVDDTAFNARKRSFTRILTIEYTAADGVTRKLKARDWSSEDVKGLKEIPRVGGKVPVFYLGSMPGFATYYDPVWHYLVPIALLALGMSLTGMAAAFCYKDIRNSNALSLPRLTEEQYGSLVDVINETSMAIRQDPADAASYESRGDAQFAMMQFREAIEDYSKALQLVPDQRDVLQKRAKAEWLEGRDTDAFKDWLKSR
jgi:tetratricopeptide (TPR) repeat protein